MTATLIGALLTIGLAANVSACSYYASPLGGGNGLSPTSPFKIADFWGVASPGKTLCLLDGVYTDSRSMINPMVGLNGTSSNKITIKALNDGKVRIDGRATNVPVRLRNNDHFVLEGFDAHNSKTGESNAVILLSAGADNNTVRRVCAWDASPTDNTAVWGSHGNIGNLLEDVCGFGTGRKIFSNSQGGNNLTIRRAWGRWERSAKTGPKQVYSFVYRSYNATFENVIGTWDETGTGGQVDQPYGVLAMDAIGNEVENKCANAKYLGSIAYVRDSQVLSGMLGLVHGGRATDCLIYENTVAFLDSNHSTRRVVSLANTNRKILAAPRKNIIYRNGTEIGGTATVGKDWEIINRASGPTVSSVPNIWNDGGAMGARVCKQYRNGTLTNTPLWPWPMNQRIIDALKAAGKTPVDVTRTMEEIFGRIPSECRSGS
jgi:hypothetical protein